MIFAHALKCNQADMREHILELIFVPAMEPMVRLLGNFSFSLAMKTTETDICAPAWFSLDPEGFLASLFLLRLCLFLFPLVGSCFEALALLSRDAPGIISETAGTEIALALSTLFIAAVRVLAS